MALRVLAVALLVAAIVTGCGSSNEEAAPVVEPVIESETIQSGRPRAPELSGTTLDGDSISLGDFRGRPVLINVWSSW